MHAHTRVIFQVRAARQGLSKHEWIQPTRKYLFWKHLKLDLEIRHVSGRPDVTQLPLVPVCACLSDTYAAKMLRQRML